ncbi:DUF4132 domain-containing protein [Clostridium sp. P21]|uniref:DUF4132 domain-containing protein n=1 Tax=Clostridium muellerianum TaxID=2716538 RepID=A0A7Y0EFA3_9CLOT|nr:DUF4132 domain-containing protein [Clostridium muellerianum]NMM62424.1 DUF4132 domain-containing protein [Clostridium muellerianum]
MEELLNLLRVKLCNCTLEKEEIIKLKEYIENGDDTLDLNEIHKYNMENTLRGNYNIRQDFWKLVDGFMDNEEVFKRILKVFWAIGQESFFKIVYSRFFSIPKFADYLKPMDNKERILVWLIRTCPNSVDIIIPIVEEMINEDREILSKAFLQTEDGFVKVVLAAFAIKNSCKLPEDGEKFIKHHLENADDINKYLRDKQTAIIQILAYARSRSEILREIVREAVNNSINRRMLFDELVDFICSYDNKVKSYDILREFDIDKKLYVLRLINLYIEEENSKVLKEIEQRIKEMPLIFRESLEFVTKRRMGKTNFQDVEALTLALVIYKNSKEDEDLNQAKKFIENILNGYIANFKGFDVALCKERAKILKYVMDGKNKECIDNYISIVDKRSIEGSIWRYHSVCFKLIYYIDETREIIYRFLYLVLNTEKYGLASSVISNVLESQSMSYISFAEKLLDTGISERHLILAADTALNPKAKEYLRKLCNEGNTELINTIDSLSVAKEFVLEGLFNADKEKYSEVLVRSLLDDSKLIRDKAVKLLSTYEGCKEMVLENFKSRKTAVREAAARILINFDMRNFTDELEKFAEKEKNEKIKVLILNIINRDYLDDEILESSESISNYCSERLKKTAYSTPEWISVNALPEVRYKDEKIISKDVISYLISKYSLENIVQKNFVAEKVIEKCNKQDLDVVGLEILKNWINDGADTKKKWTLALVTSVGGLNVVNALKDQIDIWAKNARGAIACEAIKALALNGSDEALMILDTISRKFKHKQIKKAAGEAFISAAKILKLTAEDLADRIVPNLDFNLRGERVFDYGSRSFTVTLGVDFSLKIEDNNGKTIKTLPKMGKADDELKSKEALSEFKAMKKQIKTVVSTQTLRLEMALSSNRLWSKKAWEKLFVKNPIMHNFSLGLVWGVYEEGKLKDTFRYMEDGSFNTKDEEEYELLEKDYIGLVHPLEMDKESLDDWKQQFEDYEIVQPFPQLQRKIYKITEEEKKMKVIERFAGTKINGLSLVGKLTKMGWYRGSVQDGGCYYQFYKEDEKVGIGAELQFDYLGVGYENEEITIYELIFYKASTVERGSYVYDEVTEENTILPSKVPERFFSEILYDVDRALEAKTGFESNWRLDR